MTKKSKDINQGIKPPLSLVPGVFIIHVAKALEDGAKKRSPYNYRKTPVSAMGLIDKMERHLQLIKDRHDYAEDSGLHELAHLGANISVYLDAEAQGMLDDDRPVAGKAHEVMMQFTKTDMSTKKEVKKGHCRDCGFLPNSKAHQMLCGGYVMLTKGTVDKAYSLIEEDYIKEKKG